MTLPRCRIPGCRAMGLPLVLPLSTRIVYVCARHRVPPTIARLRELMA